MKKYLSVIPLVLLLCFVVGCQDKAAMAELEEYRAQAAVEEQNKELVIRYNEAWNKGDVEALMDTLSPDIVSHTPSGRDLSLEETLEECKQHPIMYPDQSFSLEDIIVKGEKVITRWTFRGTHEGDIEGFPATGNKIEYTAIEILRVENGKFIESWEAGDVLGLYQQLGYELKPKEAGK